MGSNSYRKEIENRRTEIVELEIGNGFGMANHLPLALACGKMNAPVTWA